MSQPVRSPGKALVDFLASLRLTIFLLLILAVVSIVGTVIPQGDVPHEYLHGLSQGKLKLYQSLDLFDMYHAWWFVALLVLFTLNLIVCSVRRFPQAWKYVGNPALVLEDLQLSGVSQRLSIPLKGKKVSPEQLKALLAAHKLSQVKMTEKDGAVHLFAEKNASSRLAVYVTHLSIVVIFIGSIVGSLFGYKGYVNIVEGEAITSIQTRSGKTVELDFALRCDDFSVTTYPNGAPKEYKSILTVVGKGGEPVPGYDKVPVIVNDPLSYRGLTFYQSSYGQLDNHSFMVSGVDGSYVQHVVVSGQTGATLPDGSVIRVAEYTPDVSQHIPGKSGAAAQIEVHPADGSPMLSRVSFANHPEENIRNATSLGGMVITYAGATGFKDYTGLQVAKDPGVWIVWAGCFLLMGGIYWTFLVSHRRVWIRVTEDELTVAGHANKNQAAFANDFERLAEAVEQQVAQEEKK